MSLFTTTIAASSDDAEEIGGTVDLTGNTITITDTTDYAGLRFTGVTIPAGSTINSASLDFNVPSTSFDSPDLTIYAEDTDDAATFAASANNVSGRTPTTATATWTATDIGTGIKTSADFAAVVQEVINRGGWASGNDINIILKGRTAAADFRFSASDGANPEAEINIDYTEPAAGGGQPPRTMHQFRGRR